MEQLLEKIERELAAGYQRIKMKIKPGWDVDVIRQVRARFPGIKLMADANSAYTLADADRLKQLDEFYLMMIEQPLAHDDIIDHAVLQAKLDTPICLDECIRSAHHAEQAIRLRACGIINIKLGRVGGFREAKRVHDVAQAAGVPVWCGGHAGSGNRPRAQYRAIHAAQFRAAGRRVGQQALLGARYYRAARGDHAAGHHPRFRRTRLRLRPGPRLHQVDHRPGGVRRLSGPAVTLRPHLPDGGVLVGQLHCGEDRAARIFADVAGGAAHQAWRA